LRIPWVCTYHRRIYIQFYIYKDRFFVYLSVTRPDLIKMAMVSSSCWETLVGLSAVHKRRRRMVTLICIYKPYVYTTMISMHMYVCGHE
jgi:hypothetical protein